MPRVLKEGLVKDLTFICTECKNEFHPRARNQYRCSLKCKNKWRHEQRKEDNNLRTKKWYWANREKNKESLKEYRNKNIKIDRDNFYKNFITLIPSCRYKQSTTGYIHLRFGVFDISEHRWLMMKKIGRKLEKWEHVHHIDSNKSNNDINNLKLLSSSEHREFTHLIEENKVLRAKIKELEEMILLRQEI